MRHWLLAVIFVCALALGRPPNAHAFPATDPHHPGRSAAAGHVSGAQPEDWLMYRSGAGDMAVQYPESLRAETWKPYDRILESASFVKPDAEPGLADEHADALELTRYAKATGQSLGEWLAAEASASSASNSSGGKLFLEVRDLRPLAAEGGAYALWHRVEDHPIYAIVLDAGSTVVVLSLVADDVSEWSGLFDSYARSFSVRGKAPLRDVASAVAPSAAPLFDARDRASRGGLATSGALAATPGVRYYLPWRSGDTRRVTQGPGPDPGASSHNSQPNLHAYDFGLPEGTELWASAPGTVAHARGDIGANVCGGSAYARYVNYVVVFHNDGRATKYLHLRSVTKSSGAVGQGQLIGYSGKTGWTNRGSHLHFQRQYQGGQWEDSVPVYYAEYPGRTFYSPAQLMSRNPRSGAQAVAPSVARPPVQSLVSNWTLGTGAAPVELSWSASGSVSRYQLQQRTDGGAYATVSLPAAASTAVRRPLAPGRTYRFRVRAQNSVGYWGKWAYGPSFRVGAHQDSSGALRYAGKWTKQSLAPAYGRTVRYASAARASVRFTITAGSVGWVAHKSRTRGRANVYVDGVYMGTVDLYSATTRPRTLVYTRSWGASRTRTIEIRTLGTKGRPRVDLDAFVALR